MTDIMRASIKSFVTLLADSGHIDRMRPEKWAQTYNVETSDIIDILNEVIRDRSAPTSYELGGGK